jgi:DnaJ family protein C protein 7
VSTAWHADRHTASSEEEKKKAEHMFKDVSEAYEVLGDAEKKQRYDAGADLDDLEGHGGCGGHGGFGGHAGGIDPDLLFQMFMNGGMGGMGGGRGGFGGGGFRQGVPFSHFG